MISEVQIENYKSISNLTLPLGRVTVLIGENGSGKSNLLEAIALGSAAASNKLDNESLASKGIRVTPNPRFMRAAFDKENVDKDIVVRFKANKIGDSVERIFQIGNDNRGDTPWFNRNEKEIDAINAMDDVARMLEYYLNRDYAYGYRENEKYTVFEGEGYLEQYLLTVKRYVEPFLIYAPAYAHLSSPCNKDQLLPLGRQGERLFLSLHYLANRDAAGLTDIKELMRFMERMGFMERLQDFKTSSDFVGNISIEVKESCIAEEIGVFNQLSTDSALLFILFYFCLMEHEFPPFFAIDNIDTSLNPKLGTHLIKEIVALARKYYKQVILTAHNPAILDGLNLDDDEQRLFVVKRDLEGHTTVKRILKPKTEAGEKPVRLSEAFLRGYIGGLPSNF